MIKRLTLYLFDLYLIIDRIRIQILLKKNKRFHQEYLHMLPKIQKLYGQAKYWHGTGRYQYRVKGDSKYSADIENETYDLLKKILREGGLFPSKDVFFRVGENSDFKHSSTISVSKIRMYSRVYSDRHSYKKNKTLDVIFGSGRFIIALVFIYSALHMPVSYMLTWKSKTDERAKAGKDEFGINLPKWAETVNKSHGITSEDSFVRQGLKALALLRSDIRGNYGLLFGVKENCFHPVSLSRKVLEIFENRSKTKIPVEGFSHIEVPYDKVKEVEILLSELNLELPVIPMEFGEIYSSGKSLSSWFR